MQVHSKPRFNKSTAQALFEKHWPQTLTNFESLIEGEDSQAFRFDAGGRRYVLRINQSDYGFRKDAYACRHYASSYVPIPEVIKVGALDDDHAFCVSEFVAGETMQDHDRQAVEALLPQTLTTLQAIASTDVSQSISYGELDQTGRGQSASWQDWLLTHISRPDFEWDELVTRGVLDGRFLEQLFGAFARLVGETPNERCLVHGDFGAANVLASDNQITAVLDWDAACYGDWLFDVAGAYYWRGQQMCMAVQAEYYDRSLASLPNYGARIACYQFRAGLIEMYVQARLGEQAKLEWHIQRCRELLANSDG